MACRLLGGDFDGGEMTVNPTSKSLLIDFFSFLFFFPRSTVDVSNMHGVWVLSNVRFC